MYKGRKHDGQVVGRRFGNTHCYVVGIERKMDQAESAPGDKAEIFTPPEDMDDGGAGCKQR